MMSVEQQVLQVREKLTPEVMSALSGKDRGEHTDCIK